jgi:hypothetical protein
MFGKKKSSVNLLNLIPERVFGHTVNDKGLVVVDMPRFHISWMQKYLVPQWKKPFILIALDRFGSSAWELIDGIRTVGAIAEELTARHGDEVQPVYERLGVFIHQLERRGFIRLGGDG